MTSWELAKRRAEAPSHHGQRGLLDICLGCLPEKTQGSPREGSGGAVVQAGYTPFPRKPGVKESCFLTILSTCKRRCTGLEDEKKAESTRLGDRTEGALGLGVPGIPGQGRARERRHCLASHELPQCPGCLHSFLFLYLP